MSVEINKHNIKTSIPPAHARKLIISFTVFANALLSIIIIYVCMERRECKTSDDINKRIPINYVYNSRLRGPSRCLIANNCRDVVD